MSRGGNLTNFNTEGMVNFTSSFAGGLFSGSTSYFFKTANSTVISNPLARSVMNHVLGNTMEATGQIGSNILESHLSHK